MQTTVWNFWINVILSSGYSNMGQQPTSMSGPFVSESNFNSVFGNSEATNSKWCMHFVYGP